MQARTPDPSARSDGTDESGTDSLRNRVVTALGDEEFVSAVYRRTEGTPSYPEPNEERYDTLDGLGSVPTDERAVWEELVVYSTTHVYHWDGTLDASPTRLARSPDDA